MLRTGWNMFFVIALLLLSVGCTQTIVQRETSLPPGVSSPPAGWEDRRVLAGEWEYEDSAVVTLTLDEQGNGTYPWKEGRFETTALSDHTWYGMWFQKENDREGGFTVEFSPDFSEGEGHWWYSRIEDDRAPTQKGGTFRLRRLTSQASASNILLAP